MTRRPRGLPREVALVVGRGGVLGVLAYWILTLASYRARIEFCLALGVAVIATWRLLVAAVPPVDLSAAIVAEPEPAGGTFDNLSMLEHRLSWGSVDLERYEARVRPQLIRLAAERLRQHHGVDLAGQPEVARRIVGEPLWQLMTGAPSPAPPTQSRLADLLDQIERI